MLHLNDDQLDDLLIGDASTEAVTHVAACAECAARLELLSAPLASFKAASLAWGERRSATLPLQLRSRPASGRRMGMALGAAATAVVALALALPLLHHGSATQTAQQAVAAQPVPTAEGRATALASVEPAAAAEDRASDDQIARDNRLLEAIDRELASSETPANLLKMVGQQDTNQSSPDVSHNE